MLFRSKLLLAFGVIGLMTFAVGLVATRINSSVARDVAQIRHSSLNEGRAANEMSRALHELEISILKTRWDAAKDDAARQKTNIAASIAEFEAGLSHYQEAAEVAIALAREEKSELEIAQAQEDVGVLKIIEEKFAQLKKLVPSSQGDFPMSDAAVEAATRLYEEIHAEVEACQNATSDDLEHEIEAIAAAIHRANGIILGATVAIIVTGCLMAWFIARSVSRPLTLLTKAAEEIARGRLDTRVDFQSEDEIGLLAKTFNRMTMDLGATTVSRNYLDSILKSMANSLIVIDSNQIIKSMNEATTRMLGYTEAELIGQPLAKILPDPPWNSRLTTGENDEGLLDVETSYRMKNGEGLPVTFSASTLRAPSGSATGMVCVAQDISARKKAEMELELTGKKLLEASRQAGMAEVAANVLHNVGNTLNSVNISCSLIADSVRSSKGVNLTNAAQLIQSHEKDLAHFFSTDARGKLLPGYLADLASHLVSEKEMILQEVQSLINNITHIKEIVSMQQNYAKTTGQSEECDMAELMQSAIQINGNSLGKSGITLVREFSPVPPVKTEKHRVLQILVNLIHNAQAACEESQEADKRITFRIAKHGHRVRLSIIDNGIGIPAENLTYIFSHGFTTRKGGHGFGLHSSALTAKELGGELSVLSAGHGKGATFTLDLPLQRKETNED